MEGAAVLSPGGAGALFVSGKLALGTELVGVVVGVVTCVVVVALVVAKMKNYTCSYLWPC